MPQDLAVDTRVRLKRDVDRYPWFIAPAGSTGTVVHSENPVFAVRMDKLIPNAEDWENEIHWDGELLDGLQDDLEVCDE